MERVGVVALDDASGPGREARTSTSEWVREWSFFVWTWTLRSGGDYWLVQTVQRRFLGEEVVRRHVFSRTQWTLSVWAMVIVAAIMLVTYGLLVSAIYGDPDPNSASLLVPVLFMGLVIAPIVGLAVALVCFTFVPPRAAGPLHRG